MGSLPTQPDASDVLVDPRDPQRVYAAGTGGVARSDDAGESWEQANTGLEDTPIVDLALNPAAPDTIYAATADGDLFKSADAGATWESIGR